MKKIQSIIKIFAFLITFSALAQNSTKVKKAKLTENELKRWSHLDLEKDTIPGMSIDRVYAELLKGKKGKKIIVGVVDSGVDIEHPDLKENIWTNKKEIPNNNIDDDKNGYIDDVHGWNFLGNSVNEQLEMTRMVAKNDSLVPDFKAAKKEFDENLKEQLANKTKVDEMYYANETLVKHFGKDDFTIDEVKNITTSDAEIEKAKNVFTKIGKAGKKFMVGVNGFKDFVYDQINYNLNTQYSARGIVGDNPYNLADTQYGNNNVIGPDKAAAKHGTHVAGIIAQTRNNNLGGDGVAENVEIMGVRAVPLGDEYDKDIALAIKYAVDNGAKVINASFGKNYSPNKEWVFDAIKYAESKDVLIIHAAGNDAKNIDVEPNFPNDSNDKITEFASNVITVGALNFENGKKIVANFSNYGKLNVDVYAPGVKIYATTPDNDYQYLQGTSMASPNVAGVAAMIRSYYPNLTAKEVKEIVMNSGTAITNDIIVGGNEKNVQPFSSISLSGKIVNGFNAIKMAEELSKSKIKAKKKIKIKKRLKN